jgi:hypothetical protein
VKIGENFWFHILQPENTPLMASIVLMSLLLLLLTECWSVEPHQRPSFAEILVTLEAISRSPFVTTSHASFRSLQENWRLEIESLFDELRSKEAVSSDVDAPWVVRHLDLKRCLSSKLMK